MESGLEIEKHKIDMLKISESMINYLLDKMRNEKTARKPNIQRIQMIEQEIEQERQRLLNGFDLDILRLYFNLV